MKHMCFLVGYSFEHSFLLDELMGIYLSQCCYLVAELREYGTFTFIVQSVFQLSRKGKSQAQLAYLDHSSCT